MGFKKEKKKKEKITYIDDGRTIADMSSTSRANPIFGNDTKSSSKGRRRASLREQWNTYWAAVKMMFLPMLAVMGVITLAFIVMYFLYKP